MIEVLGERHAAEYEQLLSTVELSFIGPSAAYRRFLLRIVPDSRDVTIGVFEGGRLAGALPLIVSGASTDKPVLNSLPFFGTTGGLLIAPDANAEEIAQTLLRAVDDVAEELHAIASTIIVSPLDPHAALYERYVSRTLLDERIGQVTFLPAEPSEDALMAIFHQKTRNSIRKAQKSGFTVRHSAHINDLRALAELHRDNMQAIGGTPKPWTVFEAIREMFAYDRDYRLYLAEKDGVVASALLVFFHNRTIEYYTPATAADYRTLQPMSLLILTAMLDAIGRGIRVWNWGGTWLTQQGVYQFKSRWGTTDIRYPYYVNEFDRTLRKRTADDLLRSYPYTYVLPFSALEVRS